MKWKKYQIIPGGVIAADEIACEDCEKGEENHADTRCTNCDRWFCYECAEHGDEGGRERGWWNCMKCPGTMYK